MCVSGVEPDDCEEIGREDSENGTRDGYKVIVVVAVAVVGQYM